MAKKPVFFDASGKRAARISLIGWIAVIVSVVLGGAFVASLLAVPLAYVAAVIGGRWRQAVLILGLMALLGDQSITVVGWSEIGRQLARWLVDPAAGAGHAAIGDLMTFLAETQRALPLAMSTRWIEPPVWLAGVGPGMQRPFTSSHSKEPPLLVT